ncbi:hypothetical protein D5086_031330 [Populus alba]|uniref:Uncharacterized protein n=1 Tax=Populus alba TaxID=43335 RepID=A0ACC4AR00_POPAL
MKRQSLKLLLQSCADLVTLKQIHAQALTQGLLFIEQPLACKLVNSYAKLGNPHDAQKVFGYIQDPDRVTYTSLINLYLSTQLPIKAFSVFSKLVNEGLRPDSHAVVGALSACGKKQDLLNGKLVHGMIFRFQLGANSIVGYVRGGMPIRGLEMFKQMKTEGENQPTVITAVAVLSGCADLGAHDHGQAVHGYISKVNLDKGATVSNALMDMYSKGGCVESAMKIFDRLVKKDVFSWTTMISAHSSHGKGNHALEVFYDMLESGVIPNDVTFLLVLSGLLEEAKELIDNMPMDPDAVIWRSLLSACMNQRNLELAEIAGKKIIELEPHDDGVYVLLSNIYHVANRMKDARKMRKMMGDQKVMKKPACSYIELNGVVHEFHTENATHHASTKIYMLLEMINEHLRLDTDYSLLEMDSVYDGLL